MTLNLTELRDEPLGKHPSQAAMVCAYCGIGYCVCAADHESSSTFDVDSLNDEALDYSPTVNAFGCARPCDGIGDEVLDTPRQTEQAAPSVFTCYGHSFCGR